MIIKGGNLYPPPATAKTRGILFLSSLVVLITILFAPLL
jgi:hypothetical protein